MKKLLLCLLGTILLLSGCASFTTKTTESGIQIIPSFDNYPIQGMLAIPESNTAETLVIFVNGSGPNTYDNKRQLDENRKFTYFDLFREEFTKRGSAFFSYNTRGVNVSEEPPYFTDVDDELYTQYIPQTSVKDVVAMVKYLTKLPGLRHAKIVLLGWSEGTLIAPLVSKETNIDGLILCGYMYDDMMTILDWQQTGGSSMVFYRNYFDYDKDGFVSPDEFAEDRNGIAQYFGITYSDMDMNQDGSLNEADFAILLEPSRNELYKAIEEGDREYLKNNYGVHLTPEWFAAHKRMPANKEILPQLDIPIHIIHGTFDQNSSVEGVYATQELFKNLGKDNLTVSVYEGYNHDLNYMDYVLTGEIPEGLRAVFEAGMGM